MKLNDGQPQDQPYLRAFEYIKQFGLEPTPINYALFYDYALAVQSDRQSSLRRLIAENKVDPAAIAEINSGSATESVAALQTIKAANDALSQNAAEASQLIEEHASGVAAFQSAIVESSSRLVESPTNQDLQLLVRNLTLACSTIQDRNTQIEEQLAEVRQNFVEVQKSLAELREEAMTDALTGLLNRRGFDRAISDALSTAALTGEPLCLAVCDIDHFKAFNDQHGHLVGDHLRASLLHDTGCGANGEV